MLTFVKKGVEDMMKKTEDTTKKKGMYLVASFGAVMLIALSALAVGMLNPKDGKLPERIDLNATPTPGLPEPTSTAKQDEKSGTVSVPTPVPTDVPSGGQPTGTEQPSGGGERTAQEGSDGQESIQIGEAQEPEDSGAPVLNPDGVIRELDFSAETGMLWPITGEALIAFSPDHAVYHKTLDSYRTSNYVLLGQTAGTHVSAAADGVVTAIREELKTGTTVTMRVSADHEIVYGMLANVTVKEGDFVDAGTVFATIGEPTKYFSEDGSGVYLQVLENGKAVNPMLYLR